MDKPKVKPTASSPKTLTKTIRTVKGVKSSVGKTTKGVNQARNANQKLNEQMPSDDKHHRPEEYMTDKVMEKTEYAARKTGGKIIEKSNDAIHKGIKNISEKSIADKKSKTKQAFEKKKSETQRKSAAKKYQKKTTASKAQKSYESKRAAKNEIHTGSKTNKSVKSAQRTAKSTKKTAKATTKGIKTTAKTAQKTAKAAKQAAAIAKKAAVMTAKAVKATVKAVIAAVKAAVAAIKGLIALIAAGGWVVIVIILIIAVIMLIISSPFGAFTNESDGETPTLSEVVQEINGEYSSNINNIIINAGEIDEVIVEGETASSGYTPSNWIDVLAVFSVKSTINDNPDEYMDVAIMDEKKVEALRDIFWQMNSIAYEIQEEVIPTPEPTPSPTPNPSATPSPSDDSSPTPEPTPEIYRTLIITMECKTYIEGSEIYRFTDEQFEVLEEIMSPQYIAMYMELCGMDTFNGLTPDQLAQLINDLPEGELGSVIVEYALSRLGHPYSQALRGQGNYVDCSYFARWCYQQAGVSNFTAGTAAEQARYCVNNNLSISKSDLQAGDLIFWSFNTNGRFMDITHVGIYAGDGMVIDASSSRGMVVYRPMFGESSIVVCGRPHVKN